MMINYKLYRLMYIIALAVFIAIATDSLAASEPCDKFDGIVATTPVQPQIAEGLRLHSRQTSSRLDVDVVLIGDSLVEAWPRDLAALMARGGSFVNLGVRSDRVQNTIWRVINSPTPIRSPSVVYILIGTNSVLSEKPCSIYLGYIKLVDEIQKRWHPKSIIGISLLPRGPSLKLRAEEIASLNTMLSNISSRFPSFKNVGGKDDLMKEMSADIGGYKDDLLHLTRQGYERLTAYVISSAEKPQVVEKSKEAPHED